MPDAEISKEGTGRGYFPNYTEEEALNGVEPSATLNQLIEDAKKGTMTVDAFNSFFSGWGLSLQSINYRGWFRNQVGFAVITKEYLDSLARFLKERNTTRVVEVCAGRGFLQAPMRQRGIDWVCTDIDPTNDTVLKMGALEAVTELKPDLIFASWISYKSELDYELACLGIPMLIVGEGCGGCTGSLKFWGEHPWDASEEERLEDIKTPYDTCGMPEYFQDVLNWEGIRDFTLFVQAL